MEQFKPDAQNERAAQQFQETQKLGVHDETFFDENESRASGDKVDLATGRGIDNSSYSGHEHLTIIKGGKSKDILGDLPENNDPVARWIKAKEAGDPDADRFLEGFNKKKAA